MPVTEPKKPEVTLACSILRTYACRSILVVELKVTQYEYLLIVNAASGSKGTGYDSICGRGR